MMTGASLVEPMATTLAGRRLRVLVVGRFNSIHTRRFAEELRRQHVETAAMCLAPSTDRPQLTCYQPERTPRLFGLPKTAYFASLLFMRRAIRDFEPDLIHVQDDPRMMKWLNVVRSRTVKVAYTTWGHYPDTVLNDLGFRRSLKDAVLLASDAPDVLGEITPFAPEARRQIMRFGADFETFSVGTPDPAVLARHGLDPDCRYVLSPRSLRPSYNQLTLIRALPAVLQRYPDVRVILKHHHVENYDDADNYELDVRREAESLGVWDYVVRLDHLPYSDLCHLYRASAAAVSIPLMDGFPASIFEAMASGCPLIVSNDGSYEGVIEDGQNAMTIEPLDVEGLQEALFKVLEGGSFVDEMRARGLTTVREKGDFTKEVSRLIEAYHELESA